MVPRSLTIKANSAPVAVADSGVRRLAGTTLTVAQLRRAHQRHGRRQRRAHGGRGLDPALRYGYGLVRRRLHLRPDAGWSATIVHLQGQRRWYYGTGARHRDSSRSRRPYLSARAYPTVLSRYGLQGKVFGYLRVGSATGPVLAGRTVHLQQSSNGTSGWRDVGSATTSDSGFVLFMVKPYWKTYYRCSTVRMPRMSPTVPPPACSPEPTCAPPSRPRRCAAAATTPSTAGSSRATRRAPTRCASTSGRRPLRGKWKSYGYVNAKAYNYSSYTKYLRKIKLTSKGKWRLRAYARADSAHAAAWSSGYDYVTVK